MKVTLSFNTSGTLPGITELVLSAIFQCGGDIAAVALTEELPLEMKKQIAELMERIRDNSNAVLKGLGTLALLCAVSFLAQAQNGRIGHVRAELIPLPPPMQFVDRILRPCGSGATPFVSAIAAADGDFDITTCIGRSVTVNGVPLVITPGGGLGDPGSNGYVVRTALNTTVARTFNVSTPITITNASGVAGNTALACPTCVTSAAALTSTALMTGAGLQAAQTPSATTTLAANGNISTPGSVTTGNAGGANGAIDLSGLTSGTVRVTVAPIAGTWTLELPINDGTSGQFLQTDGGGIASWQTVPAGSTINATDNVIPKRLNAGAFTDSRITDDGATTDVVIAASTNLLLTSGSALIKIGAGLAEDAYGYSHNVGPQFYDDNTSNIMTFNVQSLSSGRTFTWPNRSATVATTTGTLTNRRFAVIDASGNFVQSTLLTEASSTDIVPVTNAVTDLGSAANSFKQLFIDATITPAGTTGAQTIDKSAGSVNFAALATSLVVTSNKVTTNSVLICTVATNDTTMKSAPCVAAAGSFTIFVDVPPTAETRVNFWVLNQ